MSQWRQLYHTYLSHFLYHCEHGAEARRSPYAGSTLAQRLRRWARRCPSIGWTSRVCCDRSHVQRDRSTRNTVRLLGNTGRALRYIGLIDREFWCDFSQKARCWWIEAARDPRSVSTINISAGPLCWRLPQPEYPPFSCTNTTHLPSWWRCCFVCLANFRSPVVVSVVHDGQNRTAHYPLWWLAMFYTRSRWTTN